MIESANIAASVVFLIVALVLWFAKTWPKLQLILFILAGAGMSAGVIGGGIQDGVVGLIDGVNRGMVWAFGSPVPGLLAVLAVVIIVLTWMGKVGWMKKAARYVPGLTALAAPIIWHLTGGIFAPLALIVGSFGSIIGAIIFGTMGLTF